MQSSQLGGTRLLGLFVLLVAALLAPAASEEVPTFSQCRPHIEATIQELANKAQGPSELTDIPFLDDAHPEPPADAEEAPPAVAEQVLEEEPIQEETPVEPEEPPVEGSPPESEVVDSDEEAEPAAEEAVSEEVPVEEDGGDEESVAAAEEPASEEDVSEDDEEDSGEVDDEDDEEQETKEEEEEEEAKEVELDDVDDEEEDEDEEVGHDDEEEDVDKEGVDAVEDDDDEDEEEDVHDDAEESDLSSEEADETIDADVDREGVEEESEEEKEDEGKDEHEGGDDDDEGESEEVGDEIDADDVSEEEKESEEQVDDDEEAEEVEMGEEVEGEKEEEEDEEVGDEDDDIEIDEAMREEDVEEDDTFEDKGDEEEDQEEEREEEEMVGSEKREEEDEEEKKREDEEEEEEKEDAEEEEEEEEGDSHDQLTAEILEPEVAAEPEPEAPAEPEPEAPAEPEPEAPAEPEPEVTLETEPEVAPETEAEEPEEPVVAEPEVSEAEVPAPAEAEEETSKPSELEEPIVETPEPVKTVPPAPIQLSFVDKFIDLIFGGVTTEPRDPKWAKPWQTHKALPESEPKPKPAQVALPKEGGFFSKTMNKFVGLIFGEVKEGKRDPKWAQPWQTHKTLPETPKEKEEETPVKKVATSGDSVQERDPKWAKPWQTHKDIEEKSKSEAPVEKKKEKKVETPEGFVRDPKWAEPWQTHKKEEASPAEEEPKPKKVSSGGFIHSFISLFFGASKEERDPKWSKPWQTHREDQEDKKVEKPKDAPKPKVPKVERDPKWAQPWQTHQQEKEKPKKAPKPAMPKVERDPKWAYPWQMHKQLEEQAKAGIPIQLPKPAKTEEAEPEPEPEPAVEDFPAPEEGAGDEDEDQEDVEQTRHEESPRGLVDDQTPARDEDKKGPVAHRVKKETKVVGDQHPDGPEATEQPVLEEVEEEEVFVIEEEEDPEQIIVVPAIRSRDHVETILGLDESSKGADARIAPVADAVLRDLKDVYDNAIKPLETLFKYQDISNRHMADAEIFGTPMVLLLGPYSTGKSSFINYLLGIEYSRSALKTGLPPSHGVFRILQHGESEHELSGTDISGSHVFSSLQKFGQNFIDQLSGKVLTSPLLKKVTLVETPGILEMRRSNERLYPLNDVLQWFIDRADLILVMFDYTKLDAGYEMEAIFDQLKGREAQTRILLNKADQVPPEELIKVQGSLFWNLSPLLGVASPPTVYAGSFSSTPYKVSSPIKLFKAQEMALLTDIANAINSKVDNRIAIARRHAVRVRNHAHMVDSYLATYYRNKGFLTSKHKLSEDIIENPHSYNIYEGMSLLTNISRYDLPDPEVYRDFFRIHNLYDFPTLKETCSYMRGCPISKIDTAISTDLPALLSRFHRLASAAGMPQPQSAHIPSPMPPMPSASRAAPPPPSTTS